MGARADGAVATGTSSSEQRAADVKRAIDAMRDAVRYLNAGDDAGALMQIELARMLVLVHASKQDRGGR
jgi:hypothetical protein